MIGGACPDVMSGRALLLFEISMKKLIIIFSLLLFCVGMFMFAQQPARVVNDTIITQTDSTRLDTTSQMKIHFNPTIHNNIKGD